MSRRKLTIILRTCGRVFALNSTRYVNKSKPEIINVCVSSLVNSINQVEDHDIELIVLDDHSGPECLADIRTIVAQCRYPSEVISLEGTGITGASQTCKEVYRLVEERATDLWYHIEDDYLHYPGAVNDMIETVDQFESNTGQMIAINPHDDIWRYTRQIYESILLLGPYRHYRTVKHTTYTCLASRAIFDRYRNHFDDAAEWILRRDENETINQVWNKPDVMLFSPIPSLALHLMEESGKDPYIDFDALWNSVPKLWKNND
jgi:glycosyltransferase involved in cell wall biosynthesis